MNEADRYRDLAERVLGRSPDGTEVSLTLDALPPEAEGKIKLPDGTRVLGGLVRRPMGELLSIAAYVASPLDAKAFGNAVRALYQADGYRQPPPPQGMMGGFQPSAMGMMGWSVLCQGEDGPWMSSSARATGSGCEGSIVWNAPAAGAGPCSPRPHGGSGFPDVLPPLEAPEGVELLPGGGGGGGSSWTSNSTAYTSLNARDLVSAFAPQLDAAGAQNLGSGGDDVVAWSQWKLAKEPWQASLVAFGRGERKELQLRIEREDYRKREDLIRRGASWRTYGF